MQFDTKASRLGEARRKGAGGLASSQPGPGPMRVAAADKLRPEAGGRSTSSASPSDNGNRAANGKKSPSGWSKCLGFAAPLRQCCPVSTFTNRDVSHAIVSNDLVALRRALTMKPHRCISMCYPGVNGGIDGTSGYALHLATRNAHPDVVAELISNGADVNLHDMSGMSPLHLAAKRGDVAVLEALLRSEQIVSVEIQDPRGCTALQYSVELAHWECAAALLRAGALAENLVLPDSSRHVAKGLQRAAEASAVCTSLWRPVVRFCAVVALPSADGSVPARTAECTHPALAAEDEGNFKRFLLMLTDSAQLTRHRELTVSTDVGMMHYNLLAPHGLLFMAVTIPDMLQSDAFRFLEKLRNRFLREFPQALRAGANSLEPFSVPQAEALVREVCTGSAYLPRVEPRLPPAYGGPQLPSHALVWMDKARALGLDRLALQPAQAAAGPSAGRPAKPAPPSLAAALPAGTSAAALGEPVSHHGHETMAYTLEMVQEYLRGQIAGIQARFDGLSRPHALVLLRQHKWSYGDVVNALEAKPGMLADFFGPAFAPPQAAQPGGKTGGRVATDAEAEVEVDDDSSRAGEWDEATTESDARLRSHLRDRVLEGAVPLCRPHADGSASPTPGDVRYVPVPDSTIERLLSEDLRERYESNIVSTFLTEASCWQACPTGCGRAIHCTLADERRQAASPAAPEVVDAACQCGAQFCWQCKARWPRLEPHAPLPCDMIAGWQSALLADESSAASAPPASQQTRAAPEPNESTGREADRGAAELRAARSRVEALAAAAARDVPLRRELAQVQHLLTLTREPVPPANVAAAAPGRPAATAITAASDVLIDSRRSLKLATIALYMLTRPLTHSGRGNASSRADESRRSRALQELPALIRRLDLVVELLGALLDIELDPTPSVDESRYAEDDLEPQSPGAGGFGRSVFGERAVALVKHSALLHRVDELKAGYATLTALATAARAALAELDSTLLLLVESSNAAAGASGGEPEAYSVGALVEAYMPGLIGSVASFWGGTKK